MNKFVKILDQRLKRQFEGWFLELTLPTMSFEEDHMLKSSMIETIFDQSMESDSQFNDLNFRAKLDCVSRNYIDYNALAQKHGAIYIRQIGSYMIMCSGFIITDYCESESWPTENQGAKIVVCENDLNAESPWIDYLQRNLPDKSINVLNTFRHRTLGDIGQNFETPSYITFYTTFSNLDWFAKLMQVARGLTGKTIIGYCTDKSKWKEVQEQFGHQIDQFVSDNNKFIIVNDLESNL